MDETQKSILVQLKQRLEQNEGEDYQVWIMAAAIAPYPRASISPKMPSVPSVLSVSSVPTHWARVVVRMSTSTGAIDYVDGTDIFVGFDKDSGTVDIETWAESWIEGPPIFEGGTIADSIEWLKEVENPCYIQLENPFQRR